MAPCFVADSTRVYFSTLGRMHFVFCTVFSSMSIAILADKIRRALRARPKRNSTHTRAFSLATSNASAVPRTTAVVDFLAGFASETSMITARLRRLGSLDMRDIWGRNGLQVVSWFLKVVKGNFLLRRLTSSIMAVPGCLLRQVSCCRLPRD